jgi:hypothetical protein
MQQGQPIHTIRELTEIGKRRATRLLKDKKLLNTLGLYDGLPEFFADVLCSSTLPVKFSTAFSLYLSASERPRNIKKRIIESEAPPYVLYEPTDPATLYRLRKFYENKAVKIGKIRRLNPFYAEIPYEIRKQHIRKQYEYLFPSRNDLEMLISRFEKAKDEKMEENLLLELSCENLTPSMAERRRENIKAFIRKFPSLPEIFVEKCLECLYTLRRKFNVIRQNGYDHIFNVLEKIAEYSSVAEEKPENQLTEAVFFGPNFTCFKVSVPENIKEKVRGMLLDNVWHFGMDYHVNHIPQFAQTVHFLEKAYKQRFG